ncbi:SAM-dependent methyltransferase [Nitrosospira briensis]|uniref:16S rRNA (Cytidine1402-2'-O)-methyltransferase n=1 Tax=Nitrosospira briensis TaxID=35799 RepID=A0A1I4XR76_9PROT|nr:SAM-dependent methyltransferase [Nitrosospira briensis]SFN27789.1 16S rRNA (cytidine1402-2'-O)-methyltransferase [Nitrosospira briensis]SFO01704.1 16S rRNA (cytidine1402-2'-O)-methyltransferase [Nitrosospira briensis]
MSSGTLYLIPAPLGNGDIAWTIPAAVRQHIAELGHYIVEHPKTARQFLKQIGCVLPLQKISMQVLDEHTQAGEFVNLLAPLLSGKDTGLLSEAGCPAVADPGAGLIRLAHKKNIRVVPLVGPSSIMLALMGSGLNGQRFAFHGYLPVENNRRVKKIVELEKESMVRDQTQIFIETPYRNQKLLEAIISSCRDDTSLCIASSLTLENEYISTRTIREWRHALPDLHNKPAVFLLQG